MNTFKPDLLHQYGDSDLPGCAAMSKYHKYTKELPVFWGRAFEGTHQAARRSMSNNPLSSPKWIRNVAEMRDGQGPAPSQLSSSESARHLATQMP